MPGQICNFALDTLGRLFVSTGFRQVRAWDGVQANDWDAGVPAPTALTATTSGQGGITGTLDAAVRWIDRFGQPSDLFLATNNPVVISSGSGTITNASNTNPIIITSSAPHGLPNSDLTTIPTTNWPQVTISGVQGNTAANGTYAVYTSTTIPVNVLSGGSFISVTLTANQFLLALVTGTPGVDWVPGNGAYTAGGSWSQGAGTFSYQAVSAAPAQAVKIQLLRTIDGDSSVFYVDLEQNATGGTFNSTNTDSQLGEAVPLFDANNNDLALERFGQPPPDKPQMVQMSGRFVAFGYPTWTQGKIAVVNGSPTVTCQNCGLTSDMQLVGRTLVVRGAANQYTISAFSAVAQTITLSGNYLDASNISAAYAILPDTGAGRRTFDFSDPLYSAAFNPLDSLAVPEDSAAGPSVGLIVLDRIAYLFAEFRAWRLSFQQSPSVDGAQALGSQRGILNTRCAIAVEDSIYVLDRQGVYVLQGGQVSALSVPVHDLFDTQRPQTGTINFRWSQYFHGVHDPENETVKWFVSMDGRYPHHALCYHYRFQKWWIENWNFAIGSSALGYVAGRPVVFLGAEGGNIFAANTGLTDGLSSSGYTTQGKVTAAGFTWFQCTGAVFNAAWPAACVSVDIVAGTGAGQRRRLANIDASNSAKYWVDQPWNVLPDTTSVFQIGGIAWTFTSGIYRFQDGNAQQPSDGASPRRIELTFQPTEGQSQFVAQLFYNHDTEPDVFENTRLASDTNGITVTPGSPNIGIQAGPITKPDGTTFANQGRTQLPMTGSRETRSGGREFLAVQLSGVTNGEKHKLYQLSLKGLTP